MTSDTMPPLTFLHLGVAVPDLAAAIRTYETVFGYQLQSGPIEDPVQRVRAAFLATPNGASPPIELVEPIGPDSPINQVLKRGTGAYHTCFEVPDLTAALESLRSAGCLIVSEPVPGIAFGGRLLAWAYLPSRQLIEVIERLPDDQP